MAIATRSPVVFKAIVFPPAFGPLMISAGIAPFSSTVTGTTG